MRLTENLFSMASWISAGLILLTLVSVVVSLAWAKRRWRIHPEIPRKCVHIAMGLVLLSLPWLFDSSVPVMVLAILTTGCMLLLRFAAGRNWKVGQVIHWSGREQRSVGDLIFPISIFFLFLCAQGDRVLYCLPLLFLTFSDPLASLVGLRWGRTRWWISRKTLEGSAGFFFSTFLCTALPLAVFTNTASTACFYIALLTGILVTLAEAASPRGLDNLTIPLAGFLSLRFFLGNEAQDLFVYTGVTAFLAFIVLLLIALLQRVRGILLALVLFFFLASVLSTVSLGGDHAAIEVSTIANE